MPHVRICGGGRGRPRSLLRTNTDQKKLHQVAVSRVVYGFLHHAASLVEGYSSRAIEVPARITTERKHSVRHPLSKYIKGEGIQSLPGISYGVNLHPLSHVAVEFYDTALKPWCPDDLGGAHANFFRLLGGNELMYFYMNFYGVHFPLKLCYQGNKLFGDLYVHLVSMRPSTVHPSHGASYQTFDLHYANLHPVLRFSASINDRGKIEQAFRNTDSHSDTDFAEHVEKHTYKGFETLQITIRREVGEAAYRKARPRVEEMLCDAADRSCLYKHYRFALVYLGVNLKHVVTNRLGNWLRRGSRKSIEARRD